ncbi:SULT1 [Mytilus coruscus]|uniref:SULT1 n=1 Tax=Mytilus coruscus TaxID=42192 RepID=A0A6J8ARA6_MYTCO|nr:SULT1 [Mytilus coruscus]
MKVHVFGNSPAVANYGLRKAVCNHTDLGTCDDVCHYVNNNFYVDDGLVSGDSPKEIVSLIKRIQDRLITGDKIRLHKIVSNNNEVLKSFETKDLAESIIEIDFNSESTCLHRSLDTFHKSECTSFDIVAPDEDQKVCSIAVESMKTSISPTCIKTLGVSRFERFSKWPSLVRAISLLKRKIVSNNRSKVDTKDTRTCVDIRKEAEALVLRKTQSQFYSNEIDCLKSRKQLPQNSNSIALSPIFDSEGLLRLGGRLKHAKLETGEKMPTISQDTLYTCTGWFNYTKEFIEAFEKNPANIIHLMYEDILKNPTEEIKRLAEFLEIPNNENLVAGVVDKCSFNKLKENKVMPFRVKGQPSSLFRKGKIGDWKNWFTVAQNEQFDAIYRNEMKDVNISFSYE